MTEQPFKVSDKVHFEHWLSTPDSPWVVSGEITAIGRYETGEPRIMIDNFFILDSYERLKRGPSPR